MKLLMLRKYHLCTHEKLFMDKIMQMLRKNYFVTQ